MNLDINDRQRMGILAQTLPPTLRVDYYLSKIPEISATTRSHSYLIRVSGNNFGRI